MINIKSDSRKIKKGDIFVAIDGINSNGSDYIESAINNGASKIVTKEGSYHVDTINVDDPKEYLTNYLIDNYNKYLNEMTIIGITGTNGKTTTAYLIYQALNLLGKKCAYIGTIGFYMKDKICNLPNTSVDTCDIYDMLMRCYHNDYKCVIMEVSSQGLSYKRFDGLEFDYVMFTNLTRDHLDYHKTMENYALAKQQLFKKLKDCGIGIVNADDNYKDYFNTKNSVSYGINLGDYKVIDYTLLSHKTVISIEYEGYLYEYTYPLIGKYNIYNMLSSIVLLNKMGYNLEELKKVVKKLKNPDGRMDVIKYNNNSIIIDYAHTPDAMENIYKSVVNLVEGNVITVFGCTGNRDRKKRPIMMQLALKYSSFVYVTSDDLHDEEFIDIVKDMLEGNENNRYKIIQDRGKAIKCAIENLKDNDMLLILGKGHEEAIIIKDKKIPFNDHKKVIEILNNIEVKI